MCTTAMFVLLSARSATVFYQARDFIKLLKYIGYRGYQTNMAAAIEVYERVRIPMYDKSAFDRRHHPFFRHAHINLRMIQALNN